MKVYKKRNKNSYNIWQLQPGTKATCRPNKIPVFKCHMASES